MNDGNAVPQKRRTIRLRGYDYRQNGAYFVTICSAKMACVFGDVIEDSMHVSSVRLSDIGRIVQEEWEQTAVLRPYVELDASVVMPNHFHGIVMIQDDETDLVGDVGARRALPLRYAPRKFGKPPARALSSIVGGFKSAVTRRVNELRATPGGVIWQRNYYEHIIRNEAELGMIRTYIEGNPGRWIEDRYYMR